MSRVGYTMHGLVSYSHPKPKKKVSGCGAKIRVGYGLKRESGPICGPIRRAIGCTLCQVSPESQSGFTIIHLSHIASICNFFVG